jgi:hypothetical protein
MNRVNFKDNIKSAKKSFDVNQRFDNYNFDINVDNSIDRKSSNTGYFN